eukprot:301265_1
MRALRTMNAAKRALISKQSQCLRSSITPYIYATRHVDVRIVSEQDNLRSSENLASTRPISPHFKIYKFPLAGLASGTQRATGVALILGWTTAGLLSLPGLPITTLPIFISFIKSVPALHGLVKFGVAFSFGYHGTKNLFMARLPRLDVESVHRAAAYAMISGITCTGIVLFLL